MIIMENDITLKVDGEGRIFFWDNLKILLIILVVVGHSVDFYTATSPMTRDIYLFIYTFHMPLFIFVSGYFSKTVLDGKQFRIAKVILYLLLYLLFILYFFAISVWLCISYVIKNIKPVIVICFSIIIGVLVGYYKIVTVVDLFSLS